MSRSEPMGARLRGGLMMHRKGCTQVGLRRQDRQGLLRNREGLRARKRGALVWSGDEEAQAGGRALMVAEQGLRGGPGRSPEGWAWETAIAWMPWELQSCPDFFPCLGCREQPAE